MNARIFSLAAVAALALTAVASDANAQSRTRAVIADGDEAYAVGPETRVIGPSRPAPRLGFQGRMTYDGLRVESVQYGSQADDMGLERGDVIVEINGQHIHSMADYQNALLDAVDFNGGRVRVLIDNVRWHNGQSSQRWVTRSVRLAVPCHDGGFSGGSFGG